MSEASKLQLSGVLAIPKEPEKPAVGVSSKIGDKDLKWWGKGTTQSLGKCLKVLFLKDFNNIGVICKGKLPMQQN